MRHLPFSTSNAAELLRDSETFGTPLLMIFLAAYGGELFGNEAAGIPPMDPVDLYGRVQDDFRAQLPEELENRWNAIAMAVSTDGFYEDPQIFVSVVVALESGDLGDMVNGVLEEIHLPEALWAIYEVGLNRDDEMHFDPRVKAVIDGYVRGEREDREGAEDGSPAYYTQFLRMKREQLVAQLGKLGVAPDKIPTV